MSCEFCTLPRLLLALRQRAFTWSIASFTRALVGSTPSASMYLQDASMRSAPAARDASANVWAVLLITLGGGGRTLESALCFLHALVPRSECSALRRSVTR